MSDDLVLFGTGLDQSLPTESEFQGVRERVTKLVNEAITTGDLDKATLLTRSLVKVAKVANRELTHILYNLNTHWEVFHTEESFIDWADREVGLHRHTIERYIRIEGLLTSPSIEPDIKKELSDRNLAELFPIANMIEQGYEPTRDQWDDILRQPDASSIGATVRDIKQLPPRPTALVIFLDESGTIWATKDNVRKFVGSLELTDDSEIVKQAVERITRNTGMLR
jgi:hypothetical protein